MALWRSGVRSPSAPPVSSLVKTSVRAFAFFLMVGPLFAAGAGRLEASTVDVIELDNKIISPVTQRYITEAIERSESDGVVCLVIEIDTPGGLLESTRAIVKRMMNA